MKRIKNEKYSFLIKNTILFTIANFSNKLIIFLLLPFYTAFLTTEEYAIIDIISTVQQLVFPIITLDITEAVIRIGIEKQKNSKNTFIIGLFIILTGNIILTIGCFTSIALSIGVKSYILYFLVFNFVISINTLLSSFLRTVDKVNTITVSSIICTLLTTVLNIILISKYRMGVRGYYISFITGNICSILIMLFGSHDILQKNKVNKSTIKLDCKEMIKYAIPLIPNGIFWWINSSLDKFFLSSISGLIYVGLYSAANKIPAILTTITNIFQQAWGLSIFKENNSKTKKEFFDKVYKIYNDIIFLVTFGIIGFTKIISSLLLKKEFYQSWSWIPILVLAFYYSSIGSFIGTEFTASKKTHWIMNTTLISALINTALNILLIPKLNGMGAAIATCISCFVLLEIRILIINKKFDLYINNVNIVKKSAITLIMAICVIFFNDFISYFIFLSFLLVIMIKNQNNFRQLIILLKKEKS